MTPKRLLESSSWFIPSRAESSVCLHDPESLLESPHGSFLHVERGAYLHDTESLLESTSWFIPSRGESVVCLHDPERKFARIPLMVHSFM